MPLSIYISIYFNKPTTLYYYTTITIQQSFHYCEATMSFMAHQITGISMVCSIVCSGIHERKYQSSTSLALCEWNPPVTDGFLSQRASNMENISMPWRHHGTHFYSNYYSVSTAMFISLCRPNDWRRSGRRPSSDYYCGSFRPYFTETEEVRKFLNHLMYPFIVTSVGLMDKWIIGH